LVGLLAAICFTAHFNRLSMAAAGDLRIMPEYGISATQMGLVYSAFFFAYTLAMIPGGWLIDRLGPRFSLAVVCLGSAAFVAMTGAVGLATSSAATALVGLVIVRGLMGLASAPLHPAASKAVSLGVPLERRSAANGIVTGAALLGVSSTFILFGGMIDRFDWPGAFFVAAGATALLGIVWARYAGERAAQTSPRVADSKKGMSPLKERAHPLFVARTFLRAHRNLLLLTFSYGAVGYFQYLFFFWTHYYFESVLELGRDHSNYYAGIPPLVMALSMPLGGWLSDRLQVLFGWRAARAGLAGVAMSASALLLLLGTRASQPVWIILWFSSALGVLGLAEGAFWSTAVEVGGNRGGLSAAIFNTGGNAGGMLAPVVTPWVSETLALGWQHGIGLGAVVCLAGAAAWIWIEPSAEANTGEWDSKKGISPLQ
jgi:MFS family permease